MPRNEISLPAKPVSTQIWIPNDDFGSLSVSRHAGHGVAPIRTHLVCAQFLLLILGNRGGLELSRGITGCGGTLARTRRLGRFTEVLTTRVKITTVI